jgi:3-isopropylmalate/(R)-2-methylmalate dehydratase small subunit
MEWIKKGRCWVFGDGIPIDGGLLPMKYIRAHEEDPQSLAQHVMEEINPRFSKDAKRGDIAVTGVRFGHGNAHIQGFLGLKALGIGLICESISRGAFRNTVTAGIPVLPSCKNIRQNVNQDDLLEVNFKTGEIKNLTQNKTILTEPLNEFLLEIIEAGGTMDLLKKGFEKPDSKKGAQ